MPQKTRTKILATIGPSTATREKIEQLIDAGADAFRFNFSHGTHAEHKERYNIVRKLAKEKNLHITIVADMQGPKLRVGLFKNDKIELKNGQKFVLDMDSTPGDETRVNLPHKEIFAALKPGDDLLLNDGNIRLHVEDCDDSHAVTTVVVGGPLSSHKGVNLPNIKLPISAITEKDRDDIEFALKLGVDWISLSFVQQAEDVREARSLINGRAWIVSKLEKPSAIEELDDIIQLSDAIMVARGDLGVECPIQTAVYDGADTVMLSAETAAGDFPVEAVQMMNNIIQQVEADPLFYTLMQSSRLKPCCAGEADSITFAASEVSNVLKKVAAIVTYTSSGLTTFLTARERPNLPILAITPDLEVARRMGIVWGAKSFVNKEGFKSFDKIEDIAKKIAVENGFAKPGQHIIITAGFPLGKKGRTNMLHTVYIPE